MPFQVHCMFLDLNSGHSDPMNGARNPPIMEYAHIFEVADHWQVGKDYTRWLANDLDLDLPALHDTVLIVQVIHGNSDWGTGTVCCPS